MALKPTIYKLRIALSDTNRHYYDTLNLTIAQHPSETIERMMVRMLAFCLNAQDNLTFAKGLSATEEPDLWARTLDDVLELWIDVGEPAPDRIKKATRLAQQVKVYCFNKKSDTWWSQGQASIKDLNAAVFQFPLNEIKALTSLVERTMDLSVTITENSAYIAAKNGECEVNWSVLQNPQ
ncbi:MAG: hypothetical protein COA71_11940 [SAR86 cluster bacterium]|uniref:YaeQ family protein n=1 Tax=SAR86 cluster bacterium TaxID=2030880 RepID=A0A2A5C8R1_9GAMM|nr:YaeQ family protein [Gammaproteobacteria bacterium AH-315-E17]PCJ40212.1 MAG: hypothetical protein COA71_11940 [SAR86 cluster bacterium]